MGTTLDQAQKNAQEASPDLVRALAIVNFRLAEIARIRKQPEAGLVALEEAMEHWLKVPMKNDGNM